MAPKRKAAPPAGGVSRLESDAGGGARGGGGGSGGAGSAVHGVSISRSVRASTKNKVRSPFILFHFLNHHLCPSTHLERAFTLSDLSGQAVTLVSSLLPPVRAFVFVTRRIEHSHFSAFYASRFSSNFTIQCVHYRKHYMIPGSR